MILNLAEGQGKTKIAYSGAYTTKTITVNGSQYTLYTITGSGTLTVKGKDQSGVGIWLCGGGANGQSLYRPGTTTVNPQRGCGGGGGYFTQQLSHTLATGNYIIEIGAAANATRITREGNVIFTAAGATTADGASGGGGYGDAYASISGAGITLYGPGTGGSASTRPFGDSTNFTSLPCAGGGGSCSSDSDDETGAFVASTGGHGGSNGASGASATRTDRNDAKPGSGGTTGGGAGFPSYYVSDTSSRNASYYGSGGGGRGGNAAGGVGYQGVVFMRVPA